MVSKLIVADECIKSMVGQTSGSPESSFYQRVNSVLGQTYDPNIECTITRRGQLGTIVDTYRGVNAYNQICYQNFYQDWNKNPDTQYNQRWCTELQNFMTRTRINIKWFKTHAPVNQCDTRLINSQGFVRLDNPITAPLGKYRLTIGLYEPMSQPREVHLFKLWEEVLNVFNGYVTFSKVEAGHQLREDSILLQISKAISKDEIKRRMLVYLKEDSSNLKQYISKTGPMFQWHHTYFHIADYTSGTSFGTDLCCLWSQLAVEKKSITFKLEDLIPRSSWSNFEPSEYVETRSSPCLRKAKFNTIFQKNIEELD